MKHKKTNIKATSYKYKMKKSETLLIFLLVCVIDGIEANKGYEEAGLGEYSKIR